MEDKRESSASPTSFTSVLKLSQIGAASVPERYVLPPSQRPNLGLCPNPAIVSPIIDLSSLHHPIHGLRIKEEVRLACKDSGFFQVSSKYLPACCNNAKTWSKKLEALSVMNDALDAATEFFELPHEEKMSLASANIREHEGIDEGSQVMAVNCYPTCPEPDLVLGMPPHSDYGYMTIILQNHQGLEIMSHDRKWYQVPVRKGALVIQIGDQMEIISNGLCKSLVHRATVNSDTDRISIASLHSLALERKVGPAPELVDDQHPLSYTEGSFSGFLDFISNNDIMEVRYIDALKKDPRRLILHAPCQLPTS